MNYELLTNKYTFMEYLKIVIGGYQTQGKYLSQFFYRNWKEAEEKHYLKDEFFSRCYGVCSLMEKDIRKQVNDQKRNLMDYLTDAKSGNPNINMNVSEQELNHLIEESENELLELILNGMRQYSVTLTDIEGGQFTGYLDYADIEEIRVALKEAEKRDEPHPTDQAKEEKLKKIETENPLIFDKELLINVHRVFNGKLWEIVDIDTLYNWFRKEPIGKIELKEGKTITGICYLIGRIDKIKKRIGVSNFDNWMTHHIRGNNYDRLKKIWINNANESEEKEEIDDLIKTL